MSVEQAKLEQMQSEIERFKQSMLTYSDEIRAQWDKLKMGIDALAEERRLFDEKVKAWELERSSVEKEKQLLRDKKLALDEQEKRLKVKASQLQQLMSD